MEKPSLDQKGKNANKNSIEQFNDSQIITECKHICNNKRLELANLKEEYNDNFLNEGQIMFEITCSNCGKPLVKNDKGAPDKELGTVFNTIRT